MVRLAPNPEKSNRSLDAKLAVAAYRGFIEHAPPQQTPYIQHARKRIAILEK